MKDVEAGTNHAQGRGCHAEAAFRKERNESMATIARGKGTVVAQAKQLIAGANKHLTNVTQVMLAGGSLTPAQVTEKLQALVNLRDDVDAAKASTKAKLVTEKAEMPQLRTFMGALVAFIKAAYVNQPDVLADFGIHPKARTPLTVEAKTAAAAKRKATRAARNTKSAKQKKGIKGDVVGITVTPVTAPQTATEPSSPSPRAPSTGTTPASTTPHTT
jgi:hypothetical protein